MNDEKFKKEILNNPQIRQMQFNEIREQIRLDKDFWEKSHLLCDKKELHKEIDEFLENDHLKYKALGIIMLYLKEYKGSK